MALCPPDPDVCINSGFPASWRDIYTGDPAARRMPCDVIGWPECFYSGQGDYVDPRNYTCGPLGMEHVFPYPDHLCQKNFYSWFLDNIIYGHDVQYAEGAGSYLRLEHSNFDHLPFITYGFNTQVFQSEGTPLFHFILWNPSLPFSPILITPCVFEIPDCSPATTRRWIGQVKHCGGGQAWGVECLKGLLVTYTDDWQFPPPAGDPQWCRQARGRPIEIPYTTLGLMSVLCTIGKGECFPYNNHYCFTDYCGDENNELFQDERRFRCIGNFDGVGEYGSDMATGADELNVSWDAKLSLHDTYKKANLHDQHIRNAVLEFATDLITELDKPGHNSYLLVPESFIPFLWESTEVWDVSHEDFAVNGAYPLVPYGTRWDGKPSSVSIPIEGRAWLSGTVYPMELRLVSAVTRIELYHERHSTNDAISRMFANMTLTVNVEKWLKLEAYDIGPFRFLEDYSDPTDHRFADPNNLGQEHPEERLVVYGPNDCRVPSKVVWRGAVLPKPLGRGADFLTACDTWGGGTLPLNEASTHCCNGLQIINKSPIYGQFNDLREEVNGARWPHLNEGWCHLNVQNLNTSGALATACKCLDTPVVP